MDEAVIRFVVPGEPVGKGRPRATRVGKGVRLYTPPKTVAYEKRVAICGRAAMYGRPPLPGALAVGLEIYLPIPASWPRKRQEMALRAEILPTGKPDVDNVEKAIFDALNGICWRDDTQVVDVIKTKRYGGIPRVHVEIRPVEGEPSTRRNA